MKYFFHFCVILLTFSLSSEEQNLTDQSQNQTIQLVELQETKHQNLLENEATKNSNSNSQNLEELKHQSEQKNKQIKHVMLQQSQKKKQSQPIPDFYDEIIDGEAMPSETNDNNLIQDDLENYKYKVKNEKARKMKPKMKKNIGNIKTRMKKGNTLTRVKKGNMETTLKMIKKMQSKQEHTKRVDLPKPKKYVQQLQNFKLKNNFMNQITSDNKQKKHSGNQIVKQQHKAILKKNQIKSGNQIVKQQHKAILKKNQIKKNQIKSGNQIIKQQHKAIADLTKHKKHIKQLKNANHQNQITKDKNLILNKQIKSGNQIVKQQHKAIADLTKHKKHIKQLKNANHQNQITKDKNNQIVKQQHKAILKNQIKSGNTIVRQQHKQILDFTKHKKHIKQLKNANHQNQITTNKNFILKQSPNTVVKQQHKQIVDLVKQKKQKRKQYQNVKLKNTVPDFMNTLAAQNKKHFQGQKRLKEKSQPNLASLFAKQNKMLQRYQRLILKAIKKMEKKKTTKTTLLNLRTKPSKKTNQLNNDQMQFDDDSTELVQEPEYKDQGAIEYEQIRDDYNVRDFSNIFPKTQSKKQQMVQLDQKLQKSRSKKA